MVTGNIHDAQQVIVPHHRHHVATKIGKRLEIGLLETKGGWRAVRWRGVRVVQEEEEGENRTASRIGKGEGRRKKEKGEEGSGRDTCIEIRLVEDLRWNKCAQIFWR
jgi:hypothetical protein